MSETVIEPVKFETKLGITYSLKWCPTQELWKVFFIFPSKAATCIARFKQQSKAVALCELLKESE